MESVPMHPELHSSRKMGSPEWRLKIDELYKSFSSGNAEGKRWARPEAPILHSLPDEKAEPHVFFHNTNYRISRKYINVEKVKVGFILRDATFILAKTEHR